MNRFVEIPGIAIEEETREIEDDGLCYDYDQSFILKKIVKYLNGDVRQILLKHPSSYIAGSFITACLDNLRWKPNDLDIFIGHEKFEECKNEFFYEERVVED